MRKQLHELNTANWEDAIRDGFEATYSKSRDFATDGIYVSRPDGSIVWVKYCPRGDRFRVRRIWLDGHFGPSKYYPAKDNGWLKALNHYLLSEYRTF